MTGHGRHIPSLKYPLPSEPIAGAATAIGKVAISVGLSLGGVLDAAAPEDYDVLAALIEGLFVRGIDSQEPVIHATAGYRFQQSGYVFRPPDTMSFAGACAVRFADRAAEISGRLDYRLEISAAWNERAAGARDPLFAEEWSECFGAELASIGGIVLGPETHQPPA